MDFSESYRYSGPPPSISPDGRYIAMAVEYRLLVRDWQTLRVIQMYSCLDKIQHVEWCSDSNYVLCGLYDRAIVQVWSVEEPEWNCKIDEGQAGITSARWCPDGRSILVTADFQLKATIWSLVDRKCVYIKGPKFSDKGIGFSPDGTKLLIAERYDCKDNLLILSCSDWKQQNEFLVDTQDLADAQWSPQGDCIAVWDCVLNYRLLIYNQEGQLLGSYSAYGGALGIKSASWSPTGQFMAIGSYDQMLRIVNNVSWEPLFSCGHSSVIGEPSNAVVYKEIEESVPGVNSKLLSAKYIVNELPVTLPAIKPPPDKPDPKLGVGVQAWSSNGKYLMTRNDNMPCVLWIWQLDCMELVAIMLQKHPVRSAVWEPDTENLAICCGTSRVYLWSPAGASVVHIPLDHFQGSAVRWSNAGAGFVLVDSDAFCVGYMMND